MRCPTCRLRYRPTDLACAACGETLPFEPLAGDAIRRPGTVSALALFNLAGAAVFALIVWLIATRLTPVRPATVTMMLGFGGLTLVELVGAWGLWRLREYGRSIQNAMAVCGLLLFPFGTIVSTVILLYLRQPGVKLLFAGRAPEAFDERERRALGRIAARPIAVGLVVACLTWGAGLFVVWVLPEVRQTIERSRQTVSMLDLHRIGSTLERYAVENQRYPEALDIYELRRTLAERAVEEVPVQDGWGHPYVIRSEPTGYVVISSGRDGVIETRPTGGPRSGFESDIIFGNGRFVQWPEGSLD